MTDEIQNQEFKPPPSVERSIDTGIFSLMMMANIHDLPADAASLAHEFGVDESGIVISSTEKLLLAAKRIGFTAKFVMQDMKRIDRAPLPAIGKDVEGRFFVLAKYEAAHAASVRSGRRKAETHSADGPDHDGKVLIQRPGEEPIVLSLESLRAEWNGELILFTSKASFSRDVSHFDFSWFIPAIVKYRKLLGEVLLISLALQMLALVTPMFFQVVMDKVLVNHAMKTLNVVATGLVMAIVFDVILTTIRTYVFSHTTSKIDVELGARLFKHLLGLPLAYFQARRVGDSVARIRELENIRNFLTGNAVTLVIDVLFSVFFMAVMFVYSPLLTMVVLASIPIYCTISLVFTPIIRARLDDKFNRSAENQAFLVETITGIDTLKSMAVEPRWQNRWEQQLAAYVASGLSVSNIGMLAGSSVTLVSKLVTATIMWVGAGLVVDGKLSVGELIAFNMLSSQVSSPILRLAQLWNDFQQIGISMSRLGDILNTKIEVTAQSTRLPRLEGAIKFEQVSFKYRPESQYVIRSLDLSIVPGEIIGIVGRSGSGKSTLTKIIQRLYLPDHGRVTVDGQDISIIETASLRGQIGVVLQENQLFSRSIRDNIALANPGSSIETIVSAAKLAGAHDFICELSEGYDTKVGEHGTGLSGGQRQRIAIARALVGNPRILIFDEATSALDYESEKVIQDSMKQICVGRTVLIIAHRLSAVRDANRILVMERGEIAEQGTHGELLQNENGIYRHLYKLQQGGSIDDFKCHRNAIRDTSSADMQSESLKVSAVA